MRLALVFALGLLLPTFGMNVLSPAYAQEEGQDAEQDPAEQVEQEAKPKKKRRSRSQRRSSQDSEGVLHDISRTRMNENSVTVLSGNRDGQSLGFAYDLSAVLDDGDNMRVLAMAGKGGAQNIRDILWLRGIDMGITQANVLNHLQKTGELGNIKGQLAYVAKLFNEEMHILTRSEIKSFEDLRGKKVNFGEAGSGTEITAQLIFAHFGMQVQEVNLDQNDALAQLKSGEIAATILIAGKPSAAFIHLPEAEGLKFLSVPYRPDMEVEYYPATLGHEDYPHLIAQGETIDTIAICTVLVAFNWDKNSYRGKKVGRFVDAFFSKFEQFHELPHHPKWREVNLGATLETWTRLPAAQEWLDKADPQVAAAEQSEFETFLAQKKTESGEPAAEPQSEAEREALFKAYLAWSKEQRPN